MADFKKAVAYVILNEGSEYTNDPDDAGGPTKFGITQEDLATWRRRPVSPDDVRNLTQDEAEQIYEAFYWLPLGCDKILDQGISTAIMDSGVLDGIVTCARWAQQIVGTNQDGHIGPLTEAALNRTSTNTFIDNLVAIITRHYEAIVAAHPQDKKFLKGWLNRADRLKTLETLKA